MAENDGAAKEWRTLIKERSDYIALVEHFLKCDVPEKAGLTKQEMIAILRPIEDIPPTPATHGGLFDLLHDSFDCDLAQKQVRISDTNLFEDALEYFENVQLPFIKRGRLYYLNASITFNTPLPRLLEHDVDVTVSTIISNDDGCEELSAPSPEPPYAEPPQKYANERIVPDLFEMLDISLDNIDARALDDQVQDMVLDPTCHRQSLLKSNNYDRRVNVHYGLMLDWLCLANTAG